MTMVRDYFYDTEFWERGPHQPINLISIGIKSRVNGWPYYAVSNEFNFWAAWNDPGVNGDYWLRDNVLSQLPLCRDANGNVVSLDYNHPSVKSLVEIRKDLEQFFELRENFKRRLWAWYADYDHVVLSQIWGVMVKLPEGMPMFTHDLKQVVDLAGNPAMPPPLEDAHHALADAEHLETMWNYCLQMGILQPPRPEQNRAVPIQDIPQA